MQNNENKPGQGAQELYEEETITARPGGNTPAQVQYSQPEGQGEYYEEEDEEEYEDDAGRRAGKGCLIMFLVVVLLVAIALGIAFLWYKSEVGGKHADATEAQVVTIASGSTTTTIGKQLEQAGVIGNNTVFRLYIKYIYDGPTEFKAGNFEIQPGMGYDDIIMLLNENPNYITTVDVRIGEGVTIMKVADTLVEHEIVGSMDEFFKVADNLALFSDIPFIARLLEDFEDTVFHASEGYIFPDTYNLELGVSAEDTVRRLYQEMDKFFTDEVYARLDELDISVREFITLASIIQAEADDVEQQPYVSDVIWNRLGPGWTQGTLGVDVTLKYIRQYMQWDSAEWAQVSRENISRDEAREYVGEDHYYAYSTEDNDSRSRVGLPAGPICSVSYSAMNAALYPEAKDGETYYFFLTTLKGNYYYATTFAQHEANIKIMYAENAEVESEEANDAG